MVGVDELIKSLHEPVLLGAQRGKLEGIEKITAARCLPAQAAENTRESTVFLRPEFRFIQQRKPAHPQLVARGPRDAGEKAVERSQRQPVHRADQFFQHIAEHRASEFRHRPARA